MTKKSLIVFSVAIVGILVAMGIIGYVAYTSPDFNILSSVATMFGRTSGGVYPKTAKVNINAVIKDENVENLAQYDVVIVDMEAQHLSPDKLQRIRELNPDVKILAAIASQEIRTDSKDYLGWNKLRYKMYKTVEKYNWWLYDDQGKNISYWPETWMVNPNSGWMHYLPAFVHKEILSTGMWDGVFYDNVWDRVSWVNGGNIDLSNNGRRENPDDLNKYWKRIMTIIMANARNFDRNTIIIANGDGDQRVYINGRHFEDMPNIYEGGYVRMRDKYFRFQETIHRNPEINIVNGSPIFTEHDGKIDLQKMRYSLGTTLLNDGYHDYDWGGSSHNKGIRFDEYNVNIGRATTGPYRIQGYSMYYDDFEGGNTGPYYIPSTSPRKGFLTNNPREVADAFYSVKGVNFTSNEWNEYLRSNLANIRFTPGETYTVKIKYKILLPNENGKYYYMLMRSDRGGVAHDKGFKSWTTSDGVMGELTTVFKLDNYDDYQLVFGIRGRGAVSIDDISINKGDSGFHVWRRDFENATILVNPTPVTQKIKFGAVHQRFKGGQDPNHNDGKLFKELDLRPYDAIIVLKKPGYSLADHNLLASAKNFFVEIVYSLMGKDVFRAY